MPYLHRTLPQAQSDYWSSMTVAQSSSSRSAIPSFLADWAVRDILREVIMGQLADQEAKCLIENCLKNIMPRDKDFLALFRWRIESVPFDGKPTVSVLPHVVNPSLRGTLINDLIHCQSWGLIDNENWHSMTDDWLRNPNLVFQRLQHTVSLVAGSMGMEIRTWDE